MRSIPPSAALRVVMAGVAVLAVGVIAVGGVFLITGGASGAAGAGPAPTRHAVRAPGSPAQTPLRPVLPTEAPVAATSGVRVTPPNLMAVSPSRVPPATLRRLARLARVRQVTVTGGGIVRVSGTALRLLAVDPAGFRPWTPKAVAEHPEVWSALAKGELVADPATVRRLGLVLGAHYQVDGGPRVRLAASASLRLPDVDGLVGEDLGRRLGFPEGVVVLIHGTPDRRVVRRLLGAETQIVTVRAADAPPASADPGQGLVGRPDNYLDLYRRSAGLCPGLSWTVLAAIGQVESGHGRNNGPSSAGALGPMQFMPGTWRAYGVDGDGDGQADIWSPYDAVPSAARYLCANGANLGGDKLRKAVWFYNHSWDYVDRVLALADAYARAYPS